MDVGVGLCKAVSKRNLWLSRPAIAFGSDCVEQSANEYDFHLTEKFSYIMAITLVWNHFDSLNWPLQIGWFYF